MAYELYRNTTLGQTLQESLDELIQTGQISPHLALIVLLQFDKSINQLLTQKVKTKISFKGKLNTYRFCDNVWTFVLQNVEFREAPVQEIARVDKEVCAVQLLYHFAQRLDSPEFYFISRTSQPDFRTHVVQVDYGVGWMGWQPVT